MLSDSLSIMFFGAYGRVFPEGDGSVTKEVPADDDMSVVRDSLFYAAMGYPIELRVLEEHVMINIPNCGKTLRWFVENTAYSNNFIHTFVKRFISANITCFENGVINADCKPDNICLKVDSDGNVSSVSIIDGSLARHTDAHINDVVFTHALSYRSPEALITSSCDSRWQLTRDAYILNPYILNMEKINVWAMGCVILYVFLGINAFFRSSYEDGDDVLRYIEMYTGDDHIIDIDRIMKNATVHRKMDEDVKRLLRMMLVVDPLKRVDMNGVCRWFEHKPIPAFYQNVACYRKPRAVRSEVLDEYIKLVVNGLGCGGSIKIKNPHYYIPKKLLVPIGGVSTSIILFDSLDLSSGCTRCCVSNLLHCLLISCYVMGCSAYTIA
ncbi:MAG: hypothetical protein QF704_13820, partial [Anaerolineales bacterium]|nr:hypothetical protein [Anaerolineales bacterium]